MFCELGGQFVDTGHEDLIALAKEFGIEMQTLATEGEGKDLYYFGGAFHTPKDMIDTATKTGAFAPIAEQIAADAEKLTDKDENWTKYALPSNGAFYSALGFQDIWEDSRAQPGEAGILTNFLGGKAGLAKENDALEIFRTGLAKMSPKMAESLDKAAVASFFWARYPFTHGGYTAAKPGQYTTLLDIAGEPVLGGRVQFAGEHTSPEFYGFMNGGVESGNRASAALIETLALKK